MDKTMTRAELVRRLWATQKRLYERGEAIIAARREVKRMEALRLRELVSTPEFKAYREALEAHEREELGEEASGYKGSDALFLLDDEYEARDPLPPHLRRLRKAMRATKQFQQWRRAHRKSCAYGAFVDDDDPTGLALDLWGHGDSIPTQVDIIERGGWIEPPRAQLRGARLVD